MPKVMPSETGERSQIPAGDHTLTLVRVKALEQENHFEAPVGMKLDGTPEYRVKKEFVWVFESDKEDGDGEPYEYAVYTGRRYGDERAKLTALLQMLLPDADDDTRAHLDTDSLIGRSWGARIQLVKTQTGKDVPRHIYLIPKDE